MSGPDERLGNDVGGRHTSDDQFQFCHVGEAVAANALVCDGAERALDHVQPQYGGRREVHDEACIAGRPLLYLGWLCVA